MHTILFVDDEPGSTQALRFLIEARGFRCISLSDMSSAVALLKKEKISVVVSDIMMPAGKDFPEIDSTVAGFHFVSQIRKDYPDISIICLSVIGDQSKIQELKEKGVLYLRKGETPLEKAASLIESKATGISRY